MEALITLIIIGTFISKFVKAMNEDTEKTARQTQQRQTVQQRPVQKTTQAQRDAYYYSQQKSTKERLQQKYGAQQKPAQKSDIISRAKGNVEETVPDKVEQQVHAEVCRDFRATAHATSDVAVHKEESPLCDTGEESDIIKRVNDLIVTGYSGDMNFERDFIAEGVDMLNRFTV